MGVFCGIYDDKNSLTKNASKIRGDHLKNFIIRLLFKMRS